MFCNGWAKLIKSDAARRLPQIIHRRLNGLLPTNDPYRAVKDRQNEMAALLIPSIRKNISSSFDPLTMAVRYAIMGNIIDLGAKNKHRLRRNLRGNAKRAHATYFRRYGRF